MRDAYKEGSGPRFSHCIATSGETLLASRCQLRHERYALTNQHFQSCCRSCEARERNQTPATDMDKLNIVLSLITEENDYPRHQAAEAEIRARRERSQSDHILAAPEHFTPIAGRNRRRPERRHGNGRQNRISGGSQRRRSPSLAGYALHRGCDGLPNTGKAGVNQRLLSATVVTPAMTGTALEPVVKSIQSKVQPPGIHTDYAALPSLARRPQPQPLRAVTSLPSILYSAGPATSAKARSTLAVPQHQSAFRPSWLRARPAKVCSGPFLASC